MPAIANEVGSDEVDNKRPVNKRYVCTYEGCSAAFGKPSRLEQHIRVHTGERPFKCQHCDQSYTRSFHLKRHVSTVHERLAAQIFLCPVEGCGRQFASEQKMRLHHEKLHAAEQLRCSFCDKTFKKNQQLKTHLYEHTGILPYQCEYEGCGKSFLLPAKLKSHIKIHKGYPCDVEGCNQQFPLWSALRKHKAEVHPKKFSCPVCNAMFKKPAFLKSHLKVHQHDREVFHCPLDDCPRWFYYKSNLKSHVDNCHNPGQFKCEAEGCGKVFNWKASLMSHAKRHKLPANVQKERKPSTADKPRKPRSDLGHPKKAIAAILSGHSVSNEENKRIMRNLD